MYVPQRLHSASVNSGGGSGAVDSGRSSGRRARWVRRVMGRSLCGRRGSVRKGPHPFCTRSDECRAERAARAEFAATFTPFTGPGLRSVTSGDRGADDGTTCPARPQQAARDTDRGSRVLQRRARPPRRPARPGARSRSALRQDLRDPVAARPAAARNHPALIAEVFTRRLGRRLSAQDLGLDACAPVYAGLEFAATPEEAVDIASGLWRKDSGSHAELRKIAFTPAGLVVPSRDWLIGRADERVGRGAEPSVVRVPVQGRAAVPRQRQIDRAPGQRVTGGDIAALRSVSELFRTLDHAYGGGHARQALVRYLEHEAEPMLRGTYGETTGRRLFSAAADLTRLAGWTSYDIAAHGLAQRYFVQALRLAQAAGDRPYGSYVLVTMSRRGGLPGPRPGGGAAGPRRPAGRRLRPAAGGAGAAALGGGARARGARRGTGGDGLAGARRAGDRRGPARGRRAALGAVLRRGAAGRRVRALPPGPAAVPGFGAARGALAAVAGAGVRAVPAVLPGGAGHGAAGAG